VTVGERKSSSTFGIYDRDEGNVPKFSGLSLQGGMVLRRQKDGAGMFWVWFVVSR
jgi:hypothetical protein